MASNQQMERIMRYGDMIRRQAGLAVRPYRADGYANMMTRYGTSRDISEQYRFVPEQTVPDELLTMFYEGNGLFAKIIDTPAEEALKHGFHLNGIADQKIEDFFSEALDELDWEETAMTAIKWTRLYGGSIAVLLVNDGRGLEKPLDWKNIRSIDDIRVYDRSLIQADTSTMFDYRPDDPFRTRGSRLGMPEYYHVFSRYGNFTVHDSRCLVFRNGILPEGATNSEYQLWGIPEYVRIHKAIRDAEIAHGSAPKLLDRSVQPVYKMKDLQQLLSTEEGEDQVLQRLRVIDMARGLLNSLVIDKDGEEYDFKTFTFGGVSNVISSACNMLSAITNIPQTILFGQTVGGLSTTDDTSTENYYNFVERIQRRMLRSNLRYLLSIIFQAGVSTGEVDEVPKIKVEFNPLWSMSDVEKADLEQKKANTQNLKARTAQIYVDMQAMDSSEVRKSLADSDEFNVEEILDEMSDDDLFPPDLAPDDPGDEDKGNAPDAAPAATKLPQDMSSEEKAETLGKRDARTDGSSGSGNWGHEGRPGKLGGSVGGGGVKNRTGSKETGFSSEAKERAKLKAGGGGESKPSATPSGIQYKHGYSDIEQMTLSSEMSAASFLMSSCGIPINEAMNHIQNGTAVETARKAIENRHSEREKRFLACPESQQKFMNMSPDDAKEFAAESYAQRIDESLNGGSRTQHMVQTLDLNDKPKVVGREEFDRIAAQSPTGPVFRGVFDNVSTGVSADEIVDMTIRGEQTFLGNGMHSDGIYFSTKKETAEGYGGYGQGRVMEACFSSGARIADYEDLLNEKALTGIADTGVFALYSGYNAIRVKANKDEDYIIALDRSALVFCDSRSDSLESIGRKSVDGRKLGKAFNEFIRFKEKNTDGAKHGDDTSASVGILVIKDGQILCGVRGDTKDTGMVCGPGGHVKEGETYEQAAVRETEEEFGIRPKDLIQFGYGPVEADSGVAPALFLCTDYDGTIATDDNEMMFARFMDMNQLLRLIESGVAFQPFADSLGVLLKELSENGENLQNRNDTLDKDTQKVIIKLSHPQHGDGGPGSGNFGHKGVPGQVGGSVGGGGSKYSQKDYEKALVGKKTVDGKVVKSITSHAVSRYKGRDIYPSSIARSLQKATPRPGNIPGRTVYQHKGTRVVLDDKDGAIVTVIYVGKGKD